MSNFSRIIRVLTNPALRNSNNHQIIVNRGIKRWVAPTLKELKRRQDRVGPEPLKPRSALLEWNYDAEIYAFGKRLSEDFDKTLLKQALTHKSYLNKQEIAAKEQNENFTPGLHNREMIKEGNEIINQFLEKKFSSIYQNQDFVKATCNYLSSDEMLAHVAKHMGVVDITLTAEFPIETTTLAETFKAIIAALNQSQNLERTHKFLDDFLVSQMIDKTLFDIWSPENPLEYLTNLLNGKEIEPRLCNQSASNTILANYQVGLYSNKKLLGIGWGESVEIAKSTAALDSIQRLSSSSSKNI